MALGGVALGPVTPKGDVQPSPTFSLGISVNTSASGWRNLLCSLLGDLGSGRDAVEPQGRATGTGGRVCAAWGRSPSRTASVGLRSSSCPSCSRRLWLSSRCHGQPVGNGQADGMLRDRCGTVPVLHGARRTTAERWVSRAPCPSGRQSPPQVPRAEDFCSASAVAH